MTGGNALLVDGQCFPLFAIGEQPVTIWHTQYQDGWPGHLHQVVIDLGAVTAFQTLSSLPRNGSDLGKIKCVRI